MSSTYSCLDYDSDTGICEECPVSTFFNEFGECEACPSYCAECGARGTCTKCVDGYYWSYNANASGSTALSTGSGSGGCTVCVGNLVAECTTDGQTPTQCKLGAYLNNSGSVSFWKFH